MPGTDLELLTRARAGHADAFGHLVERYQRLVRAVALGATGDPATSEEIAQEAFVTAWTRLDELRESERFVSWVCGIARNLARYARRHQSRHAPAASESSERLAEVPEDGPSPLDTVIGRQERMILRDALGRIPESYREPLVLFYGQERSIAEVAVVLGISRETVKQRLSRGRKYLRRGMRHMLADTLARPVGTAGMGAAVLAIIASTGPAAAGSATASLGSGLSLASVSSQMLLGSVVAASLTLAAVVLVPRATETFEPRPEEVVMLPSAPGRLARLEARPLESAEVTEEHSAPRVELGLPEVVSSDETGPSLAPSLAPALVRSRARSRVRRVEAAETVATGTPVAVFAPEVLALEAFALSQTSVVEHGPSSVSRVRARPALSFMDALGARFVDEHADARSSPDRLPIDPPDMTARILDTAL